MDILKIWLYTSIVVCIIIWSIVLSGCTTTNPQYVSSSDQRQNWSLKWKMEKQLNHERIVSSCQKYGNCKGDYEIYNPIRYK